MSMEECRRKAMEKVKDSPFLEEWMIGFAEGWEIGYAEGYSKGRREVETEVTVHLKEMGYSVEEVCELLSLDEIFVTSVFNSTE